MRKPLSSANGLSLLNWARSVIQPSPMAAVIVLARAGFASSNQRRGVTPLVLLLKRSGNISARSLTVTVRSSFEWIAATPLVLCDPTIARFAMRTCLLAPSSIKLMRCDAALVAREAGADGIEQAAVDLVDDLQVTGQHHLKPGDRPFLQGLGQQGVVRVGKSPLGQGPCLVPAKVRFVQENSHQLGDGHRRVGVVELDGDLLGKRVPVGVAAAETPHQVGQRAGHQEILLHEAQSLPHARGIIGIQYPRERLGRERLGLRADKIAAR